MKHLTKRQVLYYRLRVLKEAQDSGVTAASRKYGVNRGTIYNWQVEIMPQKTGPRGIVSWQTDSEIEELVIQTKLATNYGPKRIKADINGHNLFAVNDSVVLVDTMPSGQVVAKNRRTTLSILEREKCSLRRLKIL